MSIGSGRIRALFTGRGKTRPIPREVYSEDIREDFRNVTQTETREGAQVVTGGRVSYPAVSGRKLRDGKGRSFTPTSNRKQR